jgi:23S rRNA (uracil1939-C5)-methyltransferase
VLEVTIEKGVYRGLGLARHEGQVVFVPRGLPGERVRVRVMSASRGYLRAVVEQVLQAASERRIAPCPYADRCGGCAYQELAPPAQLALKEGILRESLGRAGIAWEGPVPIRASLEEGWRTRCSFHLEEGRDGRLRLGLHEESSHRVVDLPRCLQLSEAMNRTLRALLAGLDERRHLARRIHGVELAESLDGKQLVACLDSELSPREAPGLTALAERAPGLTGFGIVAGVEGRRRFLSLKGDPHVEATVLGVRLRSHVRSFFQANRFLVEDLVREVASRVPRGGTVLDLYAGVGLFALPLAQAAERVLGVELNPTAVEDAASNARANGIDNARIRQGDVRDGLAAWRVEGEERIVLDPPRTGAGAAVVGAIVSRRPAAVVYVACDPPTLARDLKAFGEAGYRLAALTAFDLFPDTFHVETVAQLLPE